jgi:hypothetical protein
MPALVSKSRWHKHCETFAAEETDILNRNVVGEQLGPPGLFVAITPETRPLLERMGIDLPPENDKPKSEGTSA